MKKINFTWLKAAGVRAVKTMAQTALGMVTVGAAISDINWKQVASVAVVAGVFSLLTSLAGLPETQSDGTLQIDSTSGDKTTYRLNLDGPVETLPNKTAVTFKVDPTAVLSNSQNGSSKPVATAPIASSAPVSQTDPTDVPATNVPINPDPQTGTSQK